MILGFLVVTSVLVTSLGRLGDIYGRVRMYNLGFAVYTFFSLLLTVTWMSGEAAGIWLIVMRIFQGVGAAMLMANSGAILTDAFPRGQRGMAMGINQAAAMGGMFIGLVLGGVLAPINWRLIFLVSVPIGLFGTVWGYMKLRELSARRPAKIDWPGNITFAVGLVLIMVGITYGIEPYGHDTMGWANPFVVLCLVGGAALLVVFGIIELRSEQPMFRLQLFKIRAFTAGVSPASWLRCPRRAHVHAHHLAAGDLVATAWLRLRPDAFVGRARHAPAHRRVPDSGPSRVSCPTATAPARLRPAAWSAPQSASACWSYCRLTSPTGSSPSFSSTGVTMSMFGSPNRAGVMNSLPPEHRGAGSGMNTTFQNSAQVLSIGIFFTLLIVGLSASLPESLYRGLVAHGVPLTWQLTSPICRRSPPCSPPSWATTRCSTWSGQRLVPPQLFPAGDPHRAELLSEADHRALPRWASRRSRLRHRGQPAGSSGVVEPRPSHRRFGSGTRELANASWPRSPAAVQRRRRRAQWRRASRGRIGDEEVSI